MAVVNQDTRKTIKRYIAFRDTIDELGENRNDIFTLLSDPMITYSLYCGQRIPKELIEKSQSVRAEKNKLAYEIDRRICPRLDELTNERGERYHYMTLEMLFYQDKLSIDERKEHYIKRKEILQEPEIRKRFVDYRGRLVGLYSDFISFLEGCLPKKEEK